jgi:hypothetical protein
MKLVGEFVLTPPGTPVGKDAAILSLMVKNCSASELYFCARFAFAPFVGEVWPTLTAPSGSVVPFAARVRLASLHAADFILLQPGEATVAGVRLARYFKLEQPGTYRLSAKYVCREVPPELAKLPVFVGELESDAVEFTV